MTTKATPCWRDMALLALGVFWCGLIMIGRYWLLNQHSHGYMVWNLFLAGMPLVFSFWLPWVRSRWLGAGLIAGWLVFFPNAPYVLTDVIHMRKSGGGYWGWDVLILLVTFALVGLMLGFTSLRQVHDWVEARLGVLRGWLFIVGCLFLTGFGVYLGRVLRWNSWHVLTRPSGLLRDITERVLMPQQHLQTWGFTVGFAVLLLILYAHYRGTGRDRA